jgi:hypothetical protein
MYKVLLSRILLSLAVLCTFADFVSASCSIDEARSLAGEWLANRPPSPAATGLPTNAKVGVAMATLENEAVFHAFYSYNQKTAMKPKVGHDQVGVLMLRQSDCSILTFSEAEVQ